jgi:hypothetical protein
LQIETWEESQSLARRYVQKMTLDEKIKLIQGQGILTGNDAFLVVKQEFYLGLENQG